MKMRLRPKPRPAKAATSSRAWGRRWVTGHQRGSARPPRVAGRAGSETSVQVAGILAR